MKRNIIIHSRPIYNLINKGLTENGIATYLALRTLYNTNNELVNITIDQINYIFTNELALKHNDRKISIIKKTLEELNDLGAISIINKKGINYILDLSNMYQEDTIKTEVEEIDPFDYEPTGEFETIEVNNFFVIIGLDKIQQCIKDNNGKNNILKYLICFLQLRSMNDDMYFFMDSREEIAEFCNMDIRTIDKYNKILSDNNIIYIKKSEYKYKNTGKQLTNLYGLFDHKDIIDNQYESYINENMKDLEYSPIKKKAKSKKGSNNNGK